MIDEATAPHQHADFLLRRAGLVVGTRLQPLLHHTPPVDDSSQPRVQRVDHGRDGGQQEDRRHGELDDAGDVGEVGVHAQRLVLSSSTEICASLSCHNCRTQTAKASRVAASLA